MRKKLNLLNLLPYTIPIKISMLTHLQPGNSLQFFVSMYNYTITNNNDFRLNDANIILTELSVDKIISK